MGYWESANLISHTNLSAWAITFLTWRDLSSPALMFHDITVSPGLMVSIRTIPFWVCTLASPGKQAAFEELELGENQLDCDEDELESLSEDELLEGFFRSRSCVDPLPTPKSPYFSTWFFQLAYSPGLFGSKGFHVMMISGLEDATWMSSGMRYLAHQCKVEARPFGGA